MAQEQSGSTRQENRFPDGARKDGKVVPPAGEISLTAHSLSCESSAGSSFSTRILERERVKLIVKEIEPELVSFVRGTTEKRFAEHKFPYWLFWNAREEDVLCWANCRITCRFLKRKLEEQGIKCTLKKNPAIPEPLVPYKFRGPFPSPHVVLFCGGDQAGKPDLIIDPTWMQFPLKGRLAGLEMIAVELPENIPEFVKDLERRAGQELGGAALAEVWDWEKYKPLKKGEWRRYGS